MFHSRTTDAAHKAALSKNTDKPFRLLVELVWRYKEDGVIMVATLDQMSGSIAGLSLTVVPNLAKYLP